MDRLYISRLEQCETDIKNLIVEYGNSAIYKLDPIYSRYGVDIVNHARYTLRGLIIGL